VFLKLGGNGDILYSHRQNQHICTLGKSTKWQLHELWTLWIRMYEHHTVLHWYSV